MKQSGIELSRSGFLWEVSAGTVCVAPADALSLGPERSGTKAAKDAA